MWTAQTGGPIRFSSPAIVDGTAFIGSLDHKLYAFDAAGKKECGGTPITCAPLWTATTDAPLYSSPVVADGIVYVVSTAGTLSAYDAHGTTNCSGRPARCMPLWSTNPAPAETNVSAAVANGFVFVTYADGRVYTFDTDGSTNCVGTPKTCHALWTGAVEGDPTSPVVANGVLYVGTFAADSPRVYAFDARGDESCTGTRLPKTCQPLWTAPTTGQLLSMVAVAGNVVYAADDHGNAYAFDARGTRSCSGSTVVCTPLWTGTFAGQGDFSALAVANGVLYVSAEIGPDAPSGDDRGAVFAFDAAGRMGCSGVPAACNPIVVLPTDRYVNGGSPAVANGHVYVGDTGGTLYAFALGMTPRECDRHARRCAARSSRTR